MCGQEWVTNKEIHQFYELHRKAIQADIIAMGATEARKRWQIPGSSFSKLLKDWTAPPAAPSPETGKTPPAPAAKKPKDDHGLVPLGDPQKLFIITDRDLIRIPDEDFPAAWELLGKIIRARCRQN